MERQSLNILVKPSKIQNCFQYILLMLSLVAVVLTGLSLLYKTVLLLLVGIICYRSYFYKNGFYQSIKKISGITCQSRSDCLQWSVLIDNRLVPVKLVGEQLVLPWLVVVNFEPEHFFSVASEGFLKNIYQWFYRRYIDRFSVSLWRDSMTEDEHRSLRVLLKSGM